MADAASGVCRYCKQAECSFPMECHKRYAADVISLVDYAIDCRSVDYEDPYEIGTTYGVRLHRQKSFSYARFRRSIREKEL